MVAQFLTAIGIFVSVFVFAATYQVPELPQDTPHPRIMKKGASTNLLTPTRRPIITIAHLASASATPIVSETLYPTIPWGSTTKIGNHTYRTYVGEDAVMSTNDELVTALNAYRVNHHVQELKVNDDLCTIADFRIKQLADLGKLDEHKGFSDYLAVEKNWEQLSRFTSIGENNSFGYKLSGAHLIEWVFDADDEHRGNQLNPDWNRTCVRISGTIVEMVFGQEQ